MDSDQAIVWLDDYLNKPNLGEAQITSALGAQWYLRLVSHDIHVGPSGKYDPGLVRVLMTILGYHGHKPRIYLIHIY